MTTKELDRLDQLAADIGTEHNHFLKSARTALEHAARCGDLLRKAKRKVGHGKWLDWVDSNCDFSARTAERFMRRSKARAKELKGAKSSGVSILDASSVMKALENLSNPQGMEALADALDGSADRLVNIAESQHARALPRPLNRHPAATTPTQATSDPTPEPPDARPRLRLATDDGDEPKHARRVDPEKRAVSREIKTQANTLGCMLRAVPGRLDDDALRALSRLADVMRGFL